MSYKSRAFTSVIELDGDRIVCVSYSTPVAIFIPGRGVVQTDRKYSVTTSRHVNAFMKGSSRHIVPHAEFKALIAPIAVED